jgi:xanthine dehydrogenase accessory factor
MDVYDELARLRRQGRWCALATIVQSNGSIPSYTSAKLLVRDDGSIEGTIGGGCVEAEVWTAAREVLTGRRPKRMNFTLNEDAGSDNGLICGGQLEVFIEPIEPLPGAYIFGAGHISRSLARVAGMAGFATTVIDDRDSFANRERFPEADEVLSGAYESIFPRLAINSSSYIVIVTRGHRDDLRVLRWAINTSAGYVAMIGSKRKVLGIVRELVAEGTPEERFEHLSAPMGLDIGALTPEEIAVSVVAEMIATRRGATSDWRALSMSIFGAGARRATTK